MPVPHHLHFVPTLLARHLPTNCEQRFILCAQYPPLGDYRGLPATSYVPTRRHDTNSECFGYSKRPTGRDTVCPTPTVADAD